MKIALASAMAKVARRSETEKYRHGVAGYLRIPAFNEGLLTMTPIRPKVSIYDAEVELYGRPSVGPMCGVRRPTHNDPSIERYGFCSMPMS